MHRQKDETLIRAFLKDDHFYMASLNAYNSLGVGTATNTAGFGL